MITNFEEITSHLTKEDLAVLDIVTKSIKKHSLDTPMKSSQLVYAINCELSWASKDVQLNNLKLRKYCNYIRKKGILPIIATKKGYFVSYNKDIIESQVKSLYQRANAISESAKGLSIFIINEKL